MSFLQKKEDVKEEHIDKLMQIFGRIHSGCVWSRVKPDDFTVTRFENGFINDICGCILTQSAVERLQPGADDVTGVVVKIFPKEFFLEVNVVHRAAIHCAVSDSGLGPRLIYIDSDCCVNEYIADSRSPNADDDRDIELSAHVIRMLARFHCLQVPVSDNFRTGWAKIVDKFQNEFPGAKQIKNGQFLQYLEDNPDLKGYRQVFEKMDVEKTLEYLFKAQASLDSPMVFAHMDFHRLNRVFRDKKSPEKSVSILEKEVYFLDLDATMYAYRGFDLGAFFDNHLQTKPLFGTDPFPSDEQMVPLIEVYRDQCARIKGEQYLLAEENSVARILREVKVFALYYYFISVFFALMVYCQNPKDPKKIEFARKAYARQIASDVFRKRLEDEGVLPDVGIEFQ